MLTLNRLGELLVLGMATAGLLGCTANSADVGSGEESEMTAPQGAPCLETGDCDQAPCDNAGDCESGDAPQESVDGSDNNGGTVNESDGNDLEGDGMEGALDDEDVESEPEETGGNEGHDPQIEITAILFSIGESDLVAYDNPHLQDGLETTPSLDLATSATTTQSPRAVAFDGRNALYVAGEQSIAIYEDPLTANSIRQPDRRLIDMTTRIDLPIALAMDRARNELYVAEANPQNNARLIRVYDVSSPVDGDIAPTRTFTVAGIALFRPYQLILASGSLYIGHANMDREGILVFDAPESLTGQVEPDRVISHPAIEAPADFHVDSNDRLIVTNPDTDQVNIWHCASTIDGSLPPDIVISIAAINEAQDLAHAVTDSDGRLFVLDSRRRRVYVFENVDLIDSGARVPDREFGVATDGLGRLVVWEFNEIDGTPAANREACERIEPDVSGTIFIVGPDIVAGYNNPEFLDGNAVEPTQNLAVSGPFSYVAVPQDGDLDKRGALYLASLGNDSISIYDNPASAAGARPPSRRIAGPTSQVDSPVALAVDTANDHLYVANTRNDRDVIRAYDIGSPDEFDGDIPPTRTLTIADQRFFYPVQLVFAGESLYIFPEQNAYVQGIIVLDNPGSLSGEILPDRVITHASFDFNSAISVDEQDRLLVTNPESADVRIWHNASTLDGSREPDVVISVTGVTGTQRLCHAVTDTKDHLYILDCARSVVYSFDSVTSLAGGSMVPDREFNVLSSLIASDRLLYWQR